VLLPLLFTRHWTDSSRIEQSYVTTNGSSASLSLNKEPIWVLRPDFYYRRTVAGLLIWGAISDERTGLSFTISAGTRHRSHYRVRVPWDWRPYFTVLESRLPFRRLLRLAGLRWRYSTPTPHGSPWTEIILSLVQPRNVHASQGTHVTRSSPTDAWCHRGPGKHRLLYCCVRVFRASIYCCVLVHLYGSVAWQWVFTLQYSTIVKFGSIAGVYIRILEQPWRNEFFTRYGEYRNR
jgi:hypothetical protein